MAEAALVTAVLACLALVEAPTFGQPLVEAHDFRQTQTAFPARTFHEEGFDVLHPQVPVLGEPFTIPFEFPLFQTLAALVMKAGVDVDAALRLTGAACFVVTALLLYGLVRRIAGRTSALAALVAFAFSPIALVWSRTSMIEYLATAGAVGFTWALIAWRETHRPVAGGTALAAGLVAMLVKPTTAVFWIAPALLYRPHDRVRGSLSRRGRVRTLTVVIVALPILAGILWTRHADAVKAASEATAGLTSSQLGDWNFGTVGQRTDLAVWRFIGRQAVEVLLGLGVVLLPVALFAAIRSAQLGFWLAIFVAGLGPPLVFTNLYFVHDYYLAAVSPALAALVGFGAGHVLTRLPRRVPVVAAAAAVALLVVVATLVHARGYWLRIYDADHDPSGVLPVAREVEALTTPDDLVGMVGYDWSPSILYYAHRRGHMVPRLLEGSSVRGLHDAGYRYLVVANPHEDPIALFSLWSWVGVLGVHTFAVGDSAEETMKAPVLATTKRVELASRRELLPRPRRISCGPPVRIPAGARGTWIRLRDPAGEARMFLSEDLAPVPARRLVFVDAGLGRRGSLSVSCGGAASLLVTSVRDAPRPGS